MLMAYLQKSRISVFCVTQVQVSCVHYTQRVFANPKNVAGYVNVDIDVKELKRDKLPPKAAYKQIQAYVLDKYRLKISTLNIATVKDELGLEKQFSYEKGGMAAKNRPQCPKEKHDAIVDAFRYFKMTLQEVRRGVFRR